MKPNKRKIREWRTGVRDPRWPIRMIVPRETYQRMGEAHQQAEECRCAVCGRRATYTQFGLELCREHVGWCVTCNNLATKLSNDCDPYCPFHDPPAGRGVMSEDKAKRWAERIAKGEPCLVCLKRSTQVVISRGARPEENRISGWYCEEHKGMATEIASAQATLKEFEAMGLYPKEGSE